MEERLLRCLTPEVDVGKYETGGGPLPIFVCFGPKGRMLRKVRNFGIPELPGAGEGDADGCMLEEVDEGLA